MNYKEKLDVVKANLEINRQDSNKILKFCMDNQIPMYRLFAACYIIQRQTLHEKREECELIKKMIETFLPVDHVEIIEDDGSK